MKFNSTLIQDGNTIDVLVEANNLKEAKILTKQKYTGARIIGVVEVKPSN